MCLRLTTGRFWVFGGKVKLRLTDCNVCVVSHLLRSFFVADIAFRRGFMKKEFFTELTFLSPFAPCLSSAYTPPPRIAEHSGKFPCLSTALQGWPCPFSLCRRAFGFQKVQIGQNFGFSPHMEIRQKNTLALSFWSAVYFPFTAARIYRNRGTGAALSIFLDWLKNMVFSAGYGFLWYLPPRRRPCLPSAFAKKGEHKRRSCNRLLSLSRRPLRAELFRTCAADSPFAWSFQPRKIGL